MMICLYRTVMASPAAKTLATEVRPLASTTISQKLPSSTTPVKGAGAHCEAGAGHLAHGRMYDWLDDTLAAVK